MNTSDSEEDSYNERSALVESESPTIPSYNQDHDMSLPQETDTKRVSGHEFSFLSFKRTKLDVC